jgi:hypothetical protein
VRFGPPLRRSRSSPAVNIVLVEQGKKIVRPDNDVRRDVIQRRNFDGLPRGVRGCAAMTDLEGKLERFETLAAECELIAKLATDKAKRELYSRLALHYRELAADMRKAIATKDAA